MIEHTVVAISGGVDSWCARRLRPEAAALHVNFGARSSRKALKTAVRLTGGDLIVESLGGYGRFEQPEEDRRLPHRSLLLAIVGSAYGDTVVLAGPATPPGSDQTPEAFAAFSRVLSETGGWPVRIESPFRGRTKTEVVRAYLDRFPPDELYRTISCEGDGEGHCGLCSACFRRWIAFMNNDLLADETTVSRAVPREIRRKWLPRFVRGGVPGRLLQEILEALDRADAFVPRQV